MKAVYQIKMIVRPLGLISHLLLSKTSTKLSKSSQCQQLFKKRQVRKNKRNKFLYIRQKKDQRQQRKENFKLERQIGTLDNWNHSKMTGMKDFVSLRANITTKCILSIDSTLIKSLNSNQPVSESGMQALWMSFLVLLNLAQRSIQKPKSLIILRKSHTKMSKKLWMNSGLQLISQKASLVLSPQPRSISNWQQAGQVILQSWKADVTNRGTKLKKSFLINQCLSINKKQVAKQLQISWSLWKCTIVSHQLGQSNKALIWLELLRMSRRMLYFSLDPSLWIQVSAQIIMALFQTCVKIQVKELSFQWGKNWIASHQILGIPHRSWNQRKLITGLNRF